MSKMNTNPVTLPLYGPGLECVGGSIDHEPTVTGSFAEDTITGKDGAEYALFTVADLYPAAPSIYAGTYRLSASRLRAAGADVFAE